MKLIVGLGNPGTKYASHRHNVGFMAVDRIVADHRVGNWRQKFQGICTTGAISSHRVTILKPQTYMNESGRSVGEAMRYFKLSVSDVVVLHDELDLAPGRLRVKSGGGNAGHNGLRSIQAHIGAGFWRIRIGIGHPGQKSLVHSYVLHDFSSTDSDWLDALLPSISRSAEYIAKGDMRKCAHRLNQPN